MLQKGEVAGMNFIVTIGVLIPLYAVGVVFTGSRNGGRAVHKTIGLLGLGESVYGFLGAVPPRCS